MINTQMFAQDLNMNMMISPINRPFQYQPAPQAFSYYLQPSSMPLAPQDSVPYEDFQSHNQQQSQQQQPQSHSQPLEHSQHTNYLFQHSPATSNSPLLHFSSPLLTDMAPPSSADTNSHQDFVNAATAAAENDPYFIPVQGILPPSKNLDGRYECQLCDRSYTHAKHLKRHMMRHTGQKPYGCSWCTAKFTRPDIRKRHVSKCKVRIKMEGLDCIKIEEENPARMISLKNKKMNERKAKKAAAELEKAIAAAAAATGAPATASVVATAPATTATTTAEAKPKLTVTSLSQTIVNSPVTHSDFDPSLLEASIKKELESADTFYNSPALSVHDIPTQQPPQQQQLPDHQTVYFRAMPTPSVAPSTVPAASTGYMTPAESSPIVQLMKPDEQRMCYYLNVPASAPVSGLYYEDAQQQQPQQPQYQPQMLTPQHYGMTPTQQQHAAFFNDAAACVYGESPLETFVPPIYQEQQ